MSGNGKPRLRLKTDEFDVLAAAVTGARTHRELAERLGVGYNHLLQIRKGERTPGSEFIAAVQVAMPNVSFEQVFELEYPAESETVEAGDAA